MENLGSTEKYKKEIITTHNSSTQRRQLCTFFKIEIQLIYNVVQLCTFLFLIFIYYLFIFGCVGSQLRHLGSLLQCAGSRARGLCSCARCALQLWHKGSVVAAHGLSCPAACGILVPRPGIEPVSPALEGGFLNTGPPGKSQLCTFLRKRIIK